MREINLLPPKRRWRLRSESIAVSITRFLRSIIDGLLIMSVTAVGISIIMWLLAVTANISTADDLKQEVSRFQELRDEVSLKNQSFEAISAIGIKRIVWSDVLSSFFQSVPRGILLHDLSVKVEFGDGLPASATMEVNGQALTRNTLIVYSEDLKGLGFVKGVNFPTSNLLERVNPVFNLEIDIKKP